MSEEKFISIPYSVWEDKYKPMEAKLNKLLLEKTPKQIRVVLSDATTSYRRIYDGRDLGYLEFKAFGGVELKVETQWIENYLNDLYSDLAKRWKWFTKEEIASIINSEEERYYRFKEIVDKNNKIKEGIPKFIKRLFKIK